MSHICPSYVPYMSLICPLNRQLFAALPAPNRQSDTPHTWPHETSRHPPSGCHATAYPTAGVWGARAVRHGPPGVCVCMCVCVCVCVNTHTHAHTHTHTHTHVCMDVCICVCIMCVYVHIWYTDLQVSFFFFFFYFFLLRNCQSPWTLNPKP